MTLATRCISCGTTFRVVQDQLRVSDGWVRCGRCDAVFDALESLVNLDSSDAAEQAPKNTRDPRIDPAAATGQAAGIVGHRLLERQQHDAPESQDRPIDGAVDTAAHADRADDAPPVDAGAFDDSRQISKGQPTGAPAALWSAAATAQQPRPAPPTAPAAVVAPAFMQQADREERWNSPAMRAALLGSSLILLIMLIMQVVYHQRDAIAAYSPTAATFLRSACARWNCRLEPLRRISDLSIESSALAKVAGKPQAVRLTMTLRNRGSSERAMPAVDLSLSDAQGKLIARKALLPEDFQIEPPIIAGASALPLQMVLSTGERRIAGYTVELFYP